MMLLADRLKVAEQERGNQERLTRITNLLLDKSAALRSRPSATEEYDYLWGGYTGRYYVYNPPIASIPIPATTKSPGSSSAATRTRPSKRPATCSSPRTPPVEEGPGVFRALMHKVKAQDAGVVGKIEVRQLKNRDASSEAEMYLGTRTAARWVSSS